MKLTTALFLLVAAVGLTACGKFINEDRCKFHYDAEKRYFVSEDCVTESGAKFVVADKPVVTPPDDDDDDGNTPPDDNPLPKDDDNPPTCLSNGCGPVEPPKDKPDHGGNPCGGNCGVGNGNGGGNGTGNEGNGKGPKPK